MVIKTDYILKFLYILSWIVLIGLCIEAGGFIFNTIFMLVLSPEDATKLWKEADLTAAYNYNQSYFVTLAVLMIITSVLKALMFCVIVKILHDKKFNLAKPFNDSSKRFLLNLAYLSIGIGLFSFWGAKFANECIQKGVMLPDLQHLRLAGADVWLFMGIVLLVIAFIFKKGIEIQGENDLTI